MGKSSACAPERALTGDGHHAEIRLSAWLAAPDAVQMDKWQQRHNRLQPSVKFTMPAMHSSSKHCPLESVDRRIRHGRQRLVSHAALLIALFAGSVWPASATVLTPTRDDEVIETLPAASANRAEERRQRQQLVANPSDAGLAVQLARRYLDHARKEGDPRYAGRALAALKAWPTADTAPDEVLLLLATLQQFLHDFDTSAANLERLLKRQPRHAQAWLTLATVRRVQGRFDDSSRACDGLGLAGADFYARACRAENDSLRGDSDRARTAIEAMLSAPGLPAESRNWVLTTLAESEARAGRADKAELAYRQALAAQPDAYTAMSYADFLLERKRPREALLQLKGQQRTDAVLLRLAIAGTQAGTPEAKADVREMGERIVAASLRPEARTTHARELAMYALWIDKAPGKALELARENVKHQRETLDLLVFAQSAAASKDAAALREVAALKKSIGLHDKRLDALL